MMDPSVRCNKSAGSLTAACARLKAAAALIPQNASVTAQQVTACGAALRRYGRIIRRIHANDHSGRVRMELGHPRASQRLRDLGEIWRIVRIETAIPRSLLDGGV